jgi:hypothetical protein
MPVHASRVILARRATELPPSGLDSLADRRTYLRRRRARAWPRTAIIVVVATTACCLCLAGIGGLFLGS